MFLCVILKQDVSGLIMLSQHIKESSYVIYAQQVRKSFYVSLAMYLRYPLPPHTQHHPTTHAGVRLQAQILVIVINNTFSHSIIQKFLSYY